MTTSTWKKRPDGWITDGYRIELVAPRIWVLTSRPEPSASGSDRVRVLESASSARALKAAAARLERNRRCRRRLTRRLAAVLALLALLSLTIATAPMLVLPVALTLLMVAVNTAVAWAEASGSAWTRLSETYQ